MVVALVTGGEPQPEREAPKTATAIDVDPLSYPKRGFELDRPEAWTAERDGRVVRLLSADKRIAVALAIWPRAIRARGARSAAEEAVRQGFRAVRVLRRRRASLGGGGARAVELVARRQDGALVDVLIMGTRTPWRAYSLTAVSLRPRSDDGIRQLSAVVSSIEFFEPRV